MKQFQFEYKSIDGLRDELIKISQWQKIHITSHIIFTIYTEDPEFSAVSDICKCIDSILPDADYIGCSTNGNIVNGNRSDSMISVICTIFEFPTTNVRVLQYPLTNECADETADCIISEIDNEKWVSAVELHVTIRGMSMTQFCEKLKYARRGVKIFGGGAFNSELNDNKACVFSKHFGYMEHGVVFMLMGGEDFHAYTTHVTGWKPLGKKMLVNKASGSIVYEIDGQNAYSVYNHYLDIENDEHFFNNTLEFPFFYEHHGINILRAPILSYSDGSLDMTSDIEENSIARLAYGDPETILESIEECGHEISKFSPNVIHVFSCSARRTFWGDSEVGRETMPLQSVASTSGFYTSGEFLRTDEYLNQHNVTLVIAAMREGDIPESKTSTFEMGKNEFSGTISMINRLAHFIDTATAELEEANAKLEEMAVTDGLTRLYNRVEIQNRIKNTLAKDNEPVSLIMLDIDNFKHVNDTYGHSEGDNVIVTLSDILRDSMSKYAPGASAGRWGGEEFMVLIPGTDSQAAAYVAEKIRASFEAHEFEKAGHRTISLGVTQADENRDPDQICINVDHNLYDAKRTGKNKVVVK